MHTLVNPIQDGLFWGCSRMGAAGKKVPLPKMKLLPNDETWHSYTLPKEVPKTV